MVISDAIFWYKADQIEGWHLIGTVGLHRLLPIFALYHRIQRFRVETELVVVLLPEFAQNLCSFCGRYFYFFAEEMQI